MRFSQRMAAVALVLAFSFSSLIGLAQQPFSVSDEQMAQLLARVATHADSFRGGLERALPRSVLSGSERAAYLNRFTGEFAHLAGQMKSRLKKREPVASNVQELLNRAVSISVFMETYSFNPQVAQDWQRLRADLDQLARVYRTPTRWTNPDFVNQDVAANRLDGTYLLDDSMSDEVSKMVQQAVRTLPLTERTRASRAFARQLRVPELLAIERKADRITIVSTLAAPHTYHATRQASVWPDHHEGAVVALYNDQLQLDASAQGQAYSITYDACDRGRRLRVTRTLNTTRLPRPIVINSFYRKISDAPQLDLFADESSLTRQRGNHRP